MAARLLHVPDPGKQQHQRLMIPESPGSRRGFVLPAGRTFPEA